MNFLDSEDDDLTGTHWLAKVGSKEVLPLDTGKGSLVLTLQFVQCFLSEY